MAECVILIGLPAAGKSTFYRERFAASHDHVSKDEMRNVRRRETRQAEMLETSLRAGRPVVMDNTNASRDERATAIAAARRHGAEVAGYFFSADPADARRRNRLREGKARVPDVAIFTTRKRLELPSYREGFDRLSVVTLDERSRTFVVTPVMRPHE